MIDAVFERQGDSVVATPLARGPWDPDSCHGGAPAALLATLVEQQATVSPMTTVRLTLDLLRPVPLGAPLSAHVAPLRDGRRIQLVGASLSSGGRELVRATVLRIRIADVDVAGDVDGDEAPPAGAPEDIPRFAGADIRWDEGFHVAMDIRVVEGTFGRPGAGVAWFRPVVPLLSDLDWSATARAAAAADFGNGIGSPLSWQTHFFVNPDITIALDRPPDGDWVALASASVARPTGIGLTRTSLFDRRGRIGSALQTLYVDRQGPGEEAPQD